MQPYRWAFSFALAVLVAAPAAASEFGEIPEPEALLEGVEETADAAVTDPIGTATDPNAALDRLLAPEEGEGAPGGPEREHDPGFADRIREAFQGDVTLMGLAGLALAALGVGGFAFVTRYISPKDALKNPQRAMLYGFVRGNPGVHLKKLSEEFAMKTSSILWHMRKLEAAELVHSERANGFRVFYPVEGGIEVKRVSRAVTALQNGNARALFEAVDGKPGQATTELSERLGIHVGTVRWHLRKLREFGLVEELVRDDGSTFYGTLLGRRALHAMAGAPVETAAPRSAPASILIPAAAVE